MKQKPIANWIMVGIIVAIVLSGIFIAGKILGWFDKADDSAAVLQNVRGVVNLQRSGVSSAVQADTVLHSGDQLTFQSGATATITIGTDHLILGESATVTILDPSAESFRAQVTQGSVFANCENARVLEFSGKSVTFQNTTALLSVRDGTQSISVFRGTVGDASAGQVLYYLPDSQSVETLVLSSLNDFTITQLKKHQGQVLCFTAEDLEQLEQQRQQTIQELVDSQTQLPTTQPQSPSDSTTSPTSGTTTEATLPPETTPPPAQEPATKSCTIAIYCTTILDNMDDLDPGKAEFVPESGVILYPVTVQFSEGETVFDVLKRVCSITGIQLEYSWTPLYNSYYVEGIHQLYEFDCGFESGWMYKVNGWFPNYGCSGYTLKDGDVIVWSYTCKGLGNDLGGSVG